LQKSCTVSKTLSSRKKKKRGAGNAKKVTDLPPLTDLLGPANWKEGGRWEGIRSSICRLQFLRLGGRRARRTNGHGLKRRTLGRVEGRREKRAISELSTSAATTLPGSADTKYRGAQRGHNSRKSYGRGRGEAKSQKNSFLSSNGKKRKTIRLRVALHRTTLTDFQNNDWEPGGEPY